MNKRIVKRNDTSDLRQVCTDMRLLSQAVKAFNLYEVKIRQFQFEWNVKTLKRHRIRRRTNKGVDMIVKLNDGHETQRKVRLIAQTENVLTR